MTASRLRGNRDFRILCTALGFSRLGIQVSGIAFPLLVLRITRSTTDAGLVGFAEGVALAGALLPGGAIADRWNRRAVMLASDICCAAMMAFLGAAVLLGHASIGVIIAVAVAFVALGASFSPAAGAAFRLIVSDSELPTAVSVNQARNAATVLIGPALGGLLFEISPSLPFLVDAASYAVSLLGTLAISTSLAAPARTGDAAPLPREILLGVSFIFRNRLLRFTMVNSAVLNFAFTGVLLSLIITTVKVGASGLTTGTVIAFVGMGSLIGSLLVPAVKKRLSLRQTVVVFTWVCPVTVAAMALTRSIAALAVLTGASALLVPALNVMFATAQTLTTPDALQGRVQSASSFIALSISPLGAVIAGFMLRHWPPSVTFLAFGALLLVLAAVNTVSRSLGHPSAAVIDEPASPVHQAP
jgi:MFS family permease